MSLSRSGVRVIEVATKSSLPSLSIGTRSALETETVSTATPEALGHGMHHVEVVADHGGLAGLLEAERRGGVADADQELAARLDVVEPVGRSRRRQGQQGDRNGQNRLRPMFHNAWLSRSLRKHVTASAAQQAGLPPVRPGRPNAGSTSINLPLGLTFYCSALARRAMPSRFPLRACARCNDHPRASSPQSLFSPLWP